MKIPLGLEKLSPDKAHNRGRTPLLFASWSGNAAVVKPLLWREEVNPDKPGNDGRTAASHATSEGRESVVKILLG